MVKARVIDNLVILIAQIVGTDEKHWAVSGRQCRGKQPTACSYRHIVGRSVEGSVEVSSRLLARTSTLFSTCADKTGLEFQMCNQLWVGSAFTSCLENIFFSLSVLR